MVLYKYDCNIKELYYFLADLEYSDKNITKVKFTFTTLITKYDSVSTQRASSRKGNFNKALSCLLATSCKAL